jgi:hypothetical protein
MEEMFNLNYAFGITGRSFSLPISQNLAALAKSKGIETAGGEVLPVIVPPSWNKADSHKSVAQVWKRAAIELSEAEYIYVVGYSLPETDSFFRQLFALGTVGDNLLRGFDVYNPDLSREDSFRKILGPGARSRFKFKPVDFKDAFPLLLDAIAR